jgi:hypothetical protein
MKRLWLLLVPLVALAFAPPLAAQTFEIVPQIGLTLSDYTGDNIEASTAAGFTAGGKVRIGRTFYVDGGFFWSWAGANVRDPGGMSSNLYIGSVQIPVTIGYRIGLKVIAIRIFAGALPSFVTNVSTDFDVVKDDIQSTLWSGKFGAGIDILFLAVDIAYQPGFTDIFKDPMDPKVKQNSWIIEAGFRFAF